MKIDNERAKTIIYLLLLAIQISGAIAFVWQQLPEFEQILLRPGEQLPKDPVSDLVIFGIFSAMQISFWCRLLYVPIPFRRSVTSEKMPSSEWLEVDCHAVPATRLLREVLDSP